jgi:hypothetical protein
MSEHHNFYLLLNLDPSVGDWKVIEQRIQEKQREWSRDRNMGSPRARREAESSLAQLADIKTVLADPQARREEAREAFRQQQKNKQEKTHELDDLIAVLKSSGSPCGVGKIQKLAQQFVGVFSADEIRKRLRAAGVALGEEASPDRTRRPAKEMIDQVTASNIRQNLNHLKLATLYDFLELRQQSSPKALVDRAEEIYRENQRLGRTDVDASSRNVLAGICKILFLNDREKAKYDNYLSIEVMEELKPTLELAGDDNFLSREELDTLIKQASQRGVSAEDARAYIENYAASRKWRVQCDSDALPYTNTRRELEQPKLPKLYPIAEKDLPRGPVEWLNSVPAPKVTNFSSKSLGICVLDPQGNEVVANLICIDDPVPTTRSISDMPSWSSGALCLGAPPSRSSSIWGRMVCSLSVRWTFPLE